MEQSSIGISICALAITYEIVHQNAVCILIHLFRVSAGLLKALNLTLCI